MYDLNILKSRKAENVEVICIGNVVAGGTGKTPAVQYFVKKYLNEGKKVGVLSRGYKGKRKEDLLLVRNNKEILATSVESGDEAFLHALNLKVPVVVSKDRYKGAVYLRDVCKLDIIIMDDGFQHRALARDIDIVLIDASNPFGYEHVLPRGLLREPLSGLQRADIIVLTKVDQVAPGIVSGIRKRLTQMIPNIPVYETTHKPQFMYTLDEWANGSVGASVDAYKEQRIMAVSGIGNPQSFTQTLTDVGYNVVHTLPFGDHHDFSNDDVVEIWKQAFAHQADAICITEKDAVKLSQLHAIEDLKIPILVLSIGIEFVSGKQEFIENLEI